MKFYFERYVIFSTLLGCGVRLGLADCSSKLYRC